MATRSTSRPERILGPFEGLLKVFVDLPLQVDGSMGSAVCRERPALHEYLSASMSLFETASATGETFVLDH